MFVNPKNDEFGEVKAPRGIFITELSYDIGLILQDKLADVKQPLECYDIEN